MYIFKGGFPIEDGALHGPNGRYFLPVISTGEGKKLTFWGAVILAISVVIVVVIALLGSNWLSEDYSEVLTDYADYIGDTKEEVLRSLELEASDMTMLSPGEYAVPKQIKLYNVDFDLVLYFHEDDQLLRGYGYQTRYQADPETAAKHVSRFVNKLGYKKTDGEILTLEEADLVEDFAAKEEFHLSQSWNLTPGANAVTSPISLYLSRMENSDDWPGRVAGLLAIPAAWYRDLDVSYDPHRQILSILLRYGAEARRTGVVGKR